MSSDQIRIASVFGRLHNAGDEMRMLNFARALDRDRFNHTVVVCADLEPDEAERNEKPILEQYRDEGVEVVELGTDLTRGGLARNSPGIIWALRKLFGEIRPDVVDARMRLPTALATPAARSVRVPVVTSTGYYPEEWSSPAMRMVGQAAFMGVDAFISDATHTVDDFRGWLWTNRPEWIVIPNGIQPAVATRPRSEVLASVGLADAPGLVIGQVSRFIPRKGFDILIRAAAALRDEAPDVRYLLCGHQEDTDYVEGLHKLIADLGLADRVAIATYPGPIGDVLAAIDVFSHISTEDSSPIAIHEAMSAGVPLVLSDIPGNVEMMGATDDAAMVRSGDVNDTIRVLRRLIDDPEERDRLAAAARGRYERHHTPPAMARAHEELFERLLDGRRYPR